MKYINTGLRLLSSDKLAYKYINQENESDVLMFEKSKKSHCIGQIFNIEKSDDNKYSVKETTEFSAVKDEWIVENQKAEKDYSEIKARNKAKKSALKFDDMTLKQIKEYVKYDYALATEMKHLIFSYLLER